MKFFISILLASFFLTSCHCKPGDFTREEGCIERVTVPVTAHSIDASAIPKAMALFTNNGIDYSTYRFYKFDLDSIQVQFPPFEKFASALVRVDQYANGVRIFGGEMVFNFRNGQFGTRSGHPSNGTGLTTGVQRTLPELRELILNDIEQFDHKGEEYRDSCFTAEFGYYNLNAGTANPDERLVKAWRITRKNSNFPSQYPVGYYQDKGNRIYYDNGIRTFR